MQMNNFRPKIVRKSSLLEIRRETTRERRRRKGGKGFLSEILSVIPQQHIYNLVDFFLKN